jgi:hypothetical protein
MMTGKMMKSEVMNDFTRHDFTLLMSVEEPGAIGLQNKWIWLFGHRRSSAMARQNEG